MRVVTRSPRMCVSACGAGGRRALQATSRRLRRCTRRATWCSYWTSLASSASRRGVAQGRTLGVADQSALGAALTRHSGLGLRRTAWLLHGVAAASLAVGRSGTHRTGCRWRLCSKPCATTSTRARHCLWGGRRRTTGGGWEGVWWSGVGWDRSQLGWSELSGRLAARGLASGRLSLFARSPLSPSHPNPARAVPAAGSSSLSARPLPLLGRARSPPPMPAPAATRSPQLRRPCPTPSLRRP